MHFGEDHHCLDVEVRNPNGLHLRAATQLCQQAARFKCQIIIHNDDRRIDARSILGLLTLGAGCGCRLRLETSGPDAPDALAK